MIPRSASMTLPIPESLIARLKATQQNPRYHGEGNVYNHTLMVLEQYYAYINEHEVSEEDKEVLYWASVLHDVGKIEMTRFEMGRWRSPGHEAAGVPIARDILLENGFSVEQRKRILDLVQWHFVPFRWVRKRRPLDAYKLLAIQTDLRLLGIFSMLDMMGRECEDKETVVGLVSQFNSEIVPTVTKDLGTYPELQAYFSAAGYNKKSALWASWKQGEVALLEKMLTLKVPVDSATGITCVITIGAPRSGKTQYVRTNFPNYTRIEVEDGYGNAASQAVADAARHSLMKEVAATVQRGERLVLDGTNLDPKLRSAVANIVLNASGRLHYVFFEKSLAYLLQQNQLHPHVLDEHVLIRAHKQLAYPHPWEAHSFEVV